MKDYSFFKIKLLHTFVFFSTLFSFSNLHCDEFELKQMESSFKNFITCELTRANTKNHFKGNTFTITMIDVFDIREESDITIVTGAVECFVQKTHKTLYVAVGLKKVIGSTQVAYCKIQDKDFSILATQLFKHPYKERCKWSPYWININ